jgi:glycosyltransferase involved in cell wall biosynthesis
MTLDVYGEGIEFEKYQKIAEKNEKIIFHGFADDPLEAIARSKVFVLPSYYEGLSMSLIQAAMLGKAVIATSEDGNPEIVENGKTGLLVKSRNINSLAKAMFEIVDNPAKTKQMAANIRQKYEQELNFEKTVKEKFIPLIEE